MEVPRQWLETAWNLMRANPHLERTYGHIPLDQLLTTATVGKCITGMARALQRQHERRAAGQDRRRFAKPTDNIHARVPTQPRLDLYEQVEPQPEARTPAT